MNDTVFIPHKDALLALDLVSASLQDSLDVGITLSNTPDYLRLRNLFLFNKISDLGITHNHSLIISYVDI